MGWAGGALCLPGDRRLARNRYEWAQTRRILRPTHGRCADPLPTRCGAGGAKIEFQVQVFHQLTAQAAFSSWSASRSGVIQEPGCRVQREWISNVEIEWKLAGSIGKARLRSRSVTGANVPASQVDQACSGFSQRQNYQPNSGDCQFAGLPPPDQPEAPLLKFDGSAAKTQPPASVLEADTDCPLCLVSRQGNRVNVIPLDKACPRNFHSPSVQVLILDTPPPTWHQFNP